MILSKFYIKTVRTEAGDPIKRHTVLACVLSAFVLAQMLAGCSVRKIDTGTSPPNSSPDAAQTVAGIEPSENEPSETEPSENQPSETERSDTTESAEDTPSRNFPEEGKDYVSIATKYGELRYQEQWTETMLTAQKTDGDNVVVEFTASVGENTYPLFDVIIGEAEGSPMGEITDGSGTKRSVYFNVKEIGDISALTQDEQNLLYAMQEDVNYILDNLK